MGREGRGHRQGMYVHTARHKVMQGKVTTGGAAVQVESSSHPKLPTRHRDSRAEGVCVGYRQRQVGAKGNRQAGRQMRQGHGHRHGQAR